MAPVKQEETISLQPQKKRDMMSTMSSSKQVKVSRAALGAVRPGCSLLAQLLVQQVIMSTTKAELLKASPSEVGKKFLRKHRLPCT